MGKGSLYCGRLSEELSSYISDSVIVFVICCPVWDRFPFTGYGFCIFAVFDYACANYLKPVKYGLHNNDKHFKGFLQTAPPQVCTHEELQGYA